MGSVLDKNEARMFENHTGFAMFIMIRTKDNCRTIPCQPKLVLFWNFIDEDYLLYQREQPRQPRLPRLRPSGINRRCHRICGCTSNEICRMLPCTILTRMTPARSGSANAALLLPCKTSFCRSFRPLCNQNKKKAFFKNFIIFITKVLTLTQIYLIKN